MELFCQWCDVPIPHGTTHVTLNYYVERSDGTAIDVLEASAFAVWCLECAPRREDVAAAVEDQR